MQTRRDQLLAHNFSVRRLRSAVLSGDADALQTPTRRSTIGLLVGATLGVLLIAIVGIIGILHPSNSDAWRTPGQIVVDKDSGTRYLLVRGVLHPVINITSARLVVGASAKIVHVSAASLRGAPRGVPIGIQSAPDALPDPDGVGAARWLVCTTDASASQSSGVDDTLTAVLMVTPGAGGTAAIPANAAVLVQAPDSTDYLAWQGHRLRVPDPSALIALGFDRAPPLRVSATWIDALPSGPDLRAPTISGRGDVGLPIGSQGTRVGELFVATDSGGAQSMFVMLSDGLMALNSMQAALLLADPATATAYPGQAVSAVAIGTDQALAAPHSARILDWSGLPTVRPVPAQLGGSQACVQLDTRAGAASQARLVVGRVPASSGRGSANAAHDTFAVAGDRGALVAAEAPDGSSTGARYLVDSTGTRYPLGTGDAAQRLGYSGTTTQGLPAAFLAQLPLGPTLDPARVVPLGAGS
jgi:type VII secretion protein EccB